MNFETTTDIHSFHRLNPEKVLQSLEAAGFVPTGEIHQLNSYENRVFEIVLEADSFTDDRVIAKFYRPNRWSLEALRDEHQFLLDLAEEGIPAVAPLVLKNNSTLLNCDGIYVALFPKVRARMVQELLPADFQEVGRRIAQIHNVGSRRRAEHRPSMDTGYYGGWDTLDFLADWVAPEVWSRYEAAAETILEYMDDHLEPESFIRIHGDCHKGNLLNNEKQFFFVDFDDFVNGPEVQDFWMLTDVDPKVTDEARADLLKGYESLRVFDDRQWNLIEPLRGMRIMGYAGWIAHRWTDPSFPRLFPEFNTYRYWAEDVEALEKVAWKL